MLAAGTPVTLEGWAAPGTTGPGAPRVGAIDLRLVAIEASVLPPTVQFTQSSVEMTTTARRSVVVTRTQTSGPTVALQHLLVAAQTLSATEIELSGPRPRRARPTSALGARHSSVSAVHVFLGDGGTPSFETFVSGTPAQPVTSWGAFSAVFPLPMGLERLLVLADGGTTPDLDPPPAPPDAGVMDGGTDAGLDGGALDAGPTVDGGSSTDAGAQPLDAGQLDGGAPAEAMNLAVGCGCGTSPATTIWVLLVLILSRWESAGSRSRRSA
jgi:hypothetical protein